MRSFFSFLCCNKGLFLYHVMNGSGFRYRDKNIAHKDTFFTWEWAGLGFGPETKNSSNRHFLSPLWAHPETKRSRDKTNKKNSNRLFPYLWRCLGFSTETKNTFFPGCADLGFGPETKNIPSSHFLSRFLAGSGFRCRDQKIAQIDPCLIRVPYLPYGASYHVL